MLYIWKHFIAAYELFHDEIWKKIITLDPSYLVQQVRRMHAPIYW